MRAKSLIWAACIVAAGWFFAPSEASAQIVRTQRVVVSGSLPYVSSTYVSGPFAARRLYYRPIVVYPRIAPYATYYRAYPTYIYPPHIRGGVTYFYGF